METLIQVDNTADEPKNPITILTNNPNIPYVYSSMSIHGNAAKVTTNRTVVMGRDFFQ